MSSKFESLVREIPYSQQAVYGKLSDLNNIDKVKELLPKDKVDHLSFDKDSVSISVQPVGNITLKVIERDEPKCIKFESVNSPVAFNMWIQIVQIADTSCKIKLTIQADLNIFIKGMVSKPLQEGLNKAVDVLAAVKYD